MIKIGSLVQGDKINEGKTILYDGIGRVVGCTSTTEAWKRMQKTLQEARLTPPSERKTPSTILLSLCDNEVALYWSAPANVRPFYRSEDELVIPVMFLYYRGWPPKKEAENLFNSLLEGETFVCDAWTDLWTEPEKGDKADYKQALADDFVCKYGHWTEAFIDRVIATLTLHDAKHGNLSWEGVYSSFMGLDRLLVKVLALNSELPVIPHIVVFDSCRDYMPEGTVDALFYLSLYGADIAVFSPTGEEALTELARAGGCTMFSLGEPDTRILWDARYAARQRPKRIVQRERSIREQYRKLLRRCADKH